jgi:DNA-binding cell septation regulator SpoVG
MTISKPKRSDPKIYADVEMVLDQCLLIRGITICHSHQPGSPYYIEYPDTLHPIGQKTIFEFESCIFKELKRRQPKFESTGSEISEIIKQAILDSTYKPILQQP